MEKKNSKNPKKQKLISLMFTFSKTNEQSIISEDNNEHIRNDKKLFCIFFPQFSQIFYFQLSEEEKQYSLQRFIKYRFRNIKLPGINIDEDFLIFKEFQEFGDEIMPTSKVSWFPCLKVIFNKQIKPKIIEKNTLMKIRTEFGKEHTICYDQFKKFRIHEFFIYHKLGENQFTSLMVNNQIVNHDQTLQKLSLQPRIYDAHPMFAFQSFYRQTLQIYQKLSHENFNFECLFEDHLGRNEKQIRSLKQIYKRVKCESIDHLTLKTIIYLTSPFYNIIQQKNLSNEYFHGKIETFERNKAFQTVCLMLNRMKKFESYEDTKIFIAERNDDDSIHFQGEIIRINAFTPAVCDIRHLKLRQSEQYHVYQIDHVTAKNISRYNCQHNGFTHIILPYNQYLVQSITRRGRNTHIKLFELPTPKFVHTDLILWINDNYRQTRIFKMNNWFQTMNSQIMFIKNLKVYKAWLIKYFLLTTYRKLCIVYNNANIEEGLQAVQLTRKYLGKDKKLLLYVIYDQDLEVSVFKDGVRATNSEIMVYNYIFECLGKKKQKSKKECQECNCSIY